MVCLLCVCFVSYFEEFMLNKQFFSWNIVTFIVSIWSVHNGYLNFFLVLRVDIISSFTFWKTFVISILAGRSCVITWYTTGRSCIGLRRDWRFTYATLHCWAGSQFFHTSSLSGKSNSVKGKAHGKCSGFTCATCTW